MTFVGREYHKKLYIIFCLFFLNNCQLNEPNKPHGINFLENREKVLMVGTTNQNDVIKMIGNPHSKSIKDGNSFDVLNLKLKIGQNFLKSQWHKTDFTIRETRSTILLNCQLF